ncbi:carboxymuconolactone decarboxylase family protein [Sinorhizobium meliloti]|uniref:carboxymuconolactone decarboxylase family protein n=1 Tax=Rhizobium meliloti TaxID=382 RepID=UPI000FDA3FAF|nr:carboxymuconolactone decarboxylase family protein [Sinorhizobium meliloti]MDW9639715.1 carboxymuconolactone decarboxylase [Sinorhizobium meliloti]MDW9769268.1 carboxymuconolactone decarboxylase [Sinorhizobium meliloti]MDW9808112.1 carboxymuconolactone decarboxylase [Sinorhizobium meliloti]MDW9991710.1 carboxymuconolactone decarboxylase [Sinorhizobium meliloti]MDX0126625.1 carboxymuconolactone decarboxylase [Sinorhizobium meliloti]
MTMTHIEQQLENLASPGDRQKHLRGLAVLKQIGGENFGGPVSKLAHFSEDLARFTIQYPYGDVLSRDGLDLRTRQILTTATLLAHGSAQSQLSFHLNGLLNAGGTADDVIDLLFISAGLIGFPTAINAVPIVRDILAGRVETNNATEAQSPPAIPQISSDRLAILDRIAPEFVNWREQVLDEEVFSAVHLEPRLAHLASAAMLAARGKAGASFDAHIASALATGATHSDIVEMVIQLSVYSGFPAALNAAGRANDISAASERPQASTQKGVDITKDDEKRFMSGAATLAATSGGSGADVVDSFRDIAPGLGRLIVAHCYGDIFSRSVLDPKGRELGAISALAAQGTVAAERPLGVHIDAALNLGATREEIIETLFNIIPYAGYPLIEKALLIAHDRISLFNKKHAAVSAS